MSKAFALLGTKTSVTDVKTRAGQNKWAASLSPILGLASALIAWLVTAKRECGNLGVVCTGSNYPMLAGNVAALLSPVVLVAIFTLIFGIDKYDWKSMMDIRRGDDHELTNAAGLGVEEAPANHGETGAEFDVEQKKLERAGKISKTATVVMVGPLEPSSFLTYGSKLTKHVVDTRIFGSVAHAHVWNGLHF
jgi:hypothetical protein